MLAEGLGAALFFGAAFGFFRVNDFHRRRQRFGLFRFFLAAFFRRFAVFGGGFGFGGFFCRGFCGRRLRGRLNGSRFCRGFGFCLFGRFGFGALRFLLGGGTHFGRFRLGCGACGGAGVVLCGGG